jgi:thymidylate kinase
MGRQIIRQPDGNYCVYSGDIDSFVMVNADQALLLKLLGEEARQRTIESTKDILRRIEKGENSHRPFTMTYEEAAAKDKESGRIQVEGEKGWV